MSSQSGCDTAPYMNPVHVAPDNVSPDRAIPAKGSWSDDEACCTQLGNAWRRICTQLSNAWQRTQTQLTDARRRATSWLIRKLQVGTGRSKQMNHAGFGIRVRDTIGTGFEFSLSLVFPVVAMHFAHGHYLIQSLAPKNVSPFHPVSDL